MASLSCVPLPKRWLGVRVSYVIVAIVLAEVVAVVGVVAVVAAGGGVVAGGK